MPFLNCPHIFADFSYLIGEFSITINVLNFSGQNFYLWWFENLLKVISSWKNQQLKVKVKRVTLERSQSALKPTKPHFSFGREYYKVLQSLWFKSPTLSIKNQWEFSQFFLSKTNANNKCFIVPECTCKGLQKSISE